MSKLFVICDLKRLDDFEKEKTSKKWQNNWLFGLRRTWYSIAEDYAACNQHFEGDCSPVLDADMTLKTWYSNSYHLSSFFVYLCVVDGYWGSRHPQWSASEAQHCLGQLQHYVCQEVTHTHTHLSLYLCEETHWHATLPNHNQRSDPQPLHKIWFKSEC